MQAIGQNAHRSIQVARQVPGIPTDTVPPHREADPAELRGTLYAIQPNGSDATVLKHNGETRPDGHDIPDDAVVNHRVILLTEGIGDDIQDYTRLMRGLMQSTDQPFDINVHQPLLSIHEGTSAKGDKDVERIAHDILLVKRLERGDRVDPAHAFKVDPAVQTIVNVVRQGLDAGHDMLLVPHSGGGPENALALHLLAQEGYKDAIGQHVRVLSLAGVLTPTDYHQAGVKPGHVYYTADHRDAIGGLGTIYIDPDKPDSIIHAAEEMKKNAHNHPTYHNNDDNFRDNTKNGHNQIVDFINGGPGGTYIW
ncbi:MAG TPA: hypothetical protein VGO93_02685 [Candidatus Xenobia bacterium]|jgi:hypothetical protein